MSWLENLLEMPERIRTIVNNQTRMERNMADLKQAMADLGVAVQGVSDRVGPKVTELQTQLAAAQQAVADLQAADVTDKATIDDLTGKLSDAVSGAQAAADEIEADAGKLNSIASSRAPDPVDPPVDPAPVDPPPAP